MPATIEHVSDTAHWVAMYRAVESERPDALFRDPYARRLAGPRGEAILRALPAAGGPAWALVVRTALCDALVSKLVREAGVRTVVNLAAGLDARPFRMDLPADLLWLDVDLPAMHAYKRAALAGEPPRCRLEWLAADLARADERRRVLARAAAGDGPALALTEGLLIYFAAADVRVFAEDLRACPALAWWVTDLYSPLLLPLLARGWGRAVAAGDAPFRFAPRQGARFFEPAGWREAEYRSTWEESLRLGRTFRLGGALGALWRGTSRLQPRLLRDAVRRLSGVSLLAPRPVPGRPL